MSYILQIIFLYLICLKLIFKLSGLGVCLKIQYPAKIDPFLVYFVEYLKLSDYVPFGLFEQEEY